MTKEFRLVVLGQPRTLEAHLDECILQLKALEELWYALVQGDTNIAPKKLDIYTNLAGVSHTTSEIRDKELPLLRQQTKLIEQILQHPKCPNDLELNITHTNDSLYYYPHWKDPSYARRTPIVPIFKALASGQCKAHHLTINLKGGTLLNHYELWCLLQGLQTGKCPNNLCINFESLDTPPSPYVGLPGTHIYKLASVLKSPNCSSGFSFTHKNKPLKEMFSEEYNDTLKEIDQLLDNGHYDRENIKKQIELIQNKLLGEITQEIARLQERKEDKRIDALSMLGENIINICKTEKQNIDTCLRSETWQWKNALKKQLTDQINRPLAEGLFDKAYCECEKFCRHLLNIITGLLFPLAIIKYAATGNAFYSTQGKTHETVEKALRITQSIR